MAQNAGLRVGAFDDKAEDQANRFGAAKQSLMMAVVCRIVQLTDGGSNSLAQPQI
jgi:hypothetical protein